MSTFGAGTLIVVSWILIRKYKRHRQMKEFEERVGLFKANETGFQFLVFLSYSSSDDNFVLEYILDPLQENLREITGVEKNRELVGIGDRHFIPGHTIFKEIMRCLEASAVVVCVVSHNFCDSEYCKIEIEEAYRIGKPIILLFVEEVEEALMSRAIKNVFKHYARARLVRGDDGNVQLQPGWEHLCKGIIQLIETRRENLGLANYGTFRQDYDWSI